MSLRTGWRLPLRLARRDALRHRGRSALTLAMIALPVLAVTTADVLAATQSVSAVEGLDRSLGHAAARVTVQQDVTSVEQGPDPATQTGDQESTDGAGLPSEAAVAAKLPGARLLEVRSDDIAVRTAAGQTDAEALQTDLGDPLSRGLVRLTAGRLPDTSDEVVVNQTLADDGYRIGSHLDVLQSGTDAGTTLRPTVVGIAESATGRGFPFAAGMLGSLGAATGSDDGWLVGGRSVSWSTVRALNAIGAIVLSRHVVEHPPPVSQIPRSVYLGGGRSSEDTQVLALIAIMVLIEVVLLAGPAFAVGARKQQRSLALMSASGGTPAQSRRVVLASAIVLGGVAAVTGVGLGLGLARILEPVLQGHSDTAFGPFDVRWLQLLGVAAFGLVSAFLAAAVPAFVASRQDVVAVLAGRRGDKAASRRSPVLGAVLLGAGILGSVSGAAGGGEFLIAASAIPAVLGMILLIPLVLVGLGRLSAGLPLVLRYAVRDASRHRTRTVPAVAAVAASVAGVVALSIGLSSDQRDNRETYVPTLPSGVGLVSSYTGDTDWGAVAAAVHRYAPDVSTQLVRGLPDDLDGDYVDSHISAPGGSGPIYGGGSLGASVLESDGSLPAGLIGLTADQRASSAAALRAGRSVVFLTDGATATATATGDRARLVRAVTDDQGQTLSRQSADLAVTFVTPRGTGFNGPLAIVPPAVLTTMKAQAQPVSLVVDRAAITRGQESEVGQAVAAVNGSATFYVERGYQPDQTSVILQWVLIGLGAVLMLGGTLTATFLALSDARPDLATLAAVGAAPRTRRGVGAAYALVVGLVGALLGAAVGFIPGLAIVIPLTSHGSSNGSVGGAITNSGPYYDIPWLVLFTLVIALPLVSALVIAALTRSRLPLVARLQ